MAETQFNLDNTIDTNGSGVAENNNSTTDSIGSHDNKLVRDVFITCSADRNGIHTFNINLELENPFKTIELSFQPPQPSLELSQQKSDDDDKKSRTRLAAIADEKTFYIHMPQSSFLVRLNQRVSYDECLVIKYVQLSSNSNYKIDCPKCTPTELNYLGKLFNRPTTQLDNQFDTLLSGKLSLGLAVLLSQQRLYLDLYINQK